MAMQIDWALVQQLISEYTPRNFLNSGDGYEIFRYSLGTDIDPAVYDIIDQHISYSTKVEITAENDEIIVLAPPSLLPQVPQHKKRKVKAAVPALREFLVRIPVQDEIREDYSLLKECERLSVNLTEQIGPYLEISSGRISLTFGLSLSDFCSGGIPDTANGQNITATKLFSRLLDKPGMLLPLDHEVNLVDMFEALTAPKSEYSNDPIQIEGVLTPLQKFQCQSVRWCLSREGCELRDGQVQSIESKNQGFSGWYRVGEWWVNPYNVRVQHDVPESEEYPYGGLLAEEMGLGKTLEVIALVKLHTRKDKGITYNENTGQEIRKIGATLVIVPSGILEQWTTELESHSPGIKIIQYTGKGTVSPDDLEGADVVLASYATIASEIYSAQFNPGQRNTRFWKERQDIRAVRSSLVQVQFWRVVLDEVQMLHAGVNNAARVAGLVPRVNAWAVTGTPVKNSMGDLRGQLSFLKVPYFSGKRAFDRLLTIPSDFQRLVSQIGIRHTKFLLRDELRLPPQQRKLIMLEFNEMERLFYESVQDEYMDLSDNSDRMLRTLLVKLRQACCITSTREQSVFSDSNGATLTVEQALQQLSQEAENRSTRLLRHKISLLLELGQLYLMLGEPNKAIELCELQLQALSAEIEKSIKIRDTTTGTKKALEEKIKAEKAIIRAMTFELEALGQKIAGFGLSTESEVSEGIEKEDNDSLTENLNSQESQENVVDSQLVCSNAAKTICAKTDGPIKDEDETEDERPAESNNSKKNSKLSIKAMKDNLEVVDVSSNPEFSRLRYEIIDKETALDDLRIKNHYYGNIIKSAIIHLNSCKEMEHRAFFYAATGYFRLGQKEGITDEEKEVLSTKEKEFYEKADNKRNDLLMEEQEEFMAVRDKLKEPTMFEYEAPNNVYETFFNTQAKRIKEIYIDSMAILRGGLLEMDVDNEDVYTTTMEVQDKGYVYLTALQNLIRDREQVLNGTRNLKNVKRQRSKIDSHDEERSESAQILEKWLAAELNEIRKPVDNHELSERRKVEKANEAKFKKLERDYRRKERSTDENSGDIALEKVSTVHHEYADKLKNDCRAWKRETGVLTDVFNARLKYFKSLQSISDHVREPEIADVDSAIIRKKSTIEQAEADIQSAESRLKFIAQLEIRMPGEREQKDREQDEECVICQDTYVHGSFTTCGHRCCTTCLQNWLSQNPTCPLCKTTLTPSDVFQFKYEDGIQEEDEASDESKIGTGVKKLDDGLGNDVYEHISTAKFNQILRQPLKKTYGVKIDMIVRHILLLKQQDPEVQIVIFTQWNRMLQGLTHALIQHGIRAMRKAQRNSVTQFRTDKDITCFMLHTSNDSAGLTLTNATHVILCEPLLTTAIELQAISRIHRIGQFHPTSVWLFAIQDTVEQRILALSTERRVDMARQNRKSDEAVESDILTSTVGTLVDRASGSEVVVEADMRRILDLN